jgi:chromosome partitioning protein
VLTWRAWDQKVLIVDLDAQANATSCLGVDKHTVKGGIYEVLLGISAAAGNILTNPDLKISILPSSPSLAGAEVELVSSPSVSFVCAWPCSRWSVITITS